MIPLYFYHPRGRAPKWLMNTAGAYLIEFFAYGLVWRWRSTLHVLPIWMNGGIRFSIDSSYDDWLKSHVAPRVHRLLLRRAS